MNTTSAILATVSSTVANSIVGVPLNLYVTGLIFARARETFVLEFFALNLALSDILFSLCCLCFLFFLHWGLFTFFQAFVFSWGFLLTARPLFLCCICVEYYVGVIHPVLFLQLKVLRYRVACCCAVWIATLFSCIYSLHTYDNPLYLYGFFIQNMLFFSVISFCCCSVLRALKRPGPGEKDSVKQQTNTMKRRAFKMILLILISLVINFFWFFVAIPLQCCLSTVQFANALIISLSLALITGFIQPLLYLHRASKLFCFKQL